MKRFIQKAIAALVIMTISFLCLKLYTLRYKPKNYLSAFNNKLELLRANKGKRKIVLVGGSSVGFSISGALIQEKTGVVTVNLGQNANFGLTDFQKFIMENLTDRDIIVFSPEWVFYHNPTFYDRGTLNSLIENNIKYGLITERPLYVMRALLNEITTYDWSEKRMKSSMDQQTRPYVYDCLNANGDVISHCGLKKKGPRKEPLEIRDFDYQKFSNAFPFVRSRKTVLLFPPTPKYMYEAHEAEFHMVEEKLARYGVTVMNSVKDNVYPDSGFFDETNHLSCGYRVLRTNQILDYFKSHYTFK